MIGGNKCGWYATLGVYPPRLACLGVAQRAKTGAGWIHANCAGGLGLKETGHAAVSGMPHGLIQVE